MDLSCLSVSLPLFFFFLGGGGQFLTMITKIHRTVCMKHVRPRNFTSSEGQIIHHWSSLPVERECLSRNLLSNKITKPEEWSPCPSHQLKHSNGVKDGWVPNKTFKLVMAHQLLSNEANCIQPNQIQSIVHSNSQHSATWRSDQKLVGQ